MSSIRPGAEGLLARFEANENGNWPDWFNRRRAKAWSCFGHLDFPTVKDEAWRFTNPKPLVETPFVPAERASVDDADWQRLGLEELGPHRIVFVNGRFDPVRSSLDGLPAGVQVSTLRDALGSEGPWEGFVGTLSPVETHAFAALNVSLAGDGAAVHVTGSAQVDEPIHIVHVSVPDGTPRDAFVHHAVQVDDGCSVRIVESFASASEGVFLTNVASEVVVGDGARLDHVRLQTEGPEALLVASTRVRQGRDSRYTAHNVDLGGLLVRNDHHVEFAGEGATATLNGLYQLDGAQHVDNHTYVDHAVPHCTSREFYKGVLDGHSHGVFHGTVLVRKDAQLTDSHQSNKNLILSDDALADSTPALEINADDVKCGHGSTVGQLDRDQVFYLRTRGVDRAMAESLLTYAFAKEVVDSIDDPAVLRRIERHLESRLPAGDLVHEALHEPDA